MVSSILLFIAMIASYILSYLTQWVRVERNTFCSKKHLYSCCSSVRFLNDGKSLKLHEYVAVIAIWKWVPVYVTFVNIVSYQYACWVVYLCQSVYCASPQQHYSWRSLPRPVKRRSDFWYTLNFASLRAASQCSQSGNLRATWARCHRRQGLSWETSLNRLRRS